MVELRLEQPSKNDATQIATLPVQELNGAKKVRLMTSDDL